MDLLPIGKLASIGLLICTCGYSTRSLLPSHVRTIGIKSVENSTTQPGLAEELMLKLPQALGADGNLRISSPEAADLLLEVVINGYYRTASAYDADQNITAYEITVTAEVDVKDQIRNEPFFTGTVSSRLSYTPASKSDETAITETVEKLAREIVRQIITAW